MILVTPETSNSTARVARVALPDSMKHLPKDSRGYPIPAIVFRDGAGKPYFTVNADDKVQLCGKNRWCGVCGRKMHKNDTWFVGGPGSAFHEHGAYRDGPLHIECARYALKVCPYLAVPKFAKELGARLMPEETQKQAGVMVDTTTIPDRPVLFVLGRADGYRMGRSLGAAIFHPVKPFATVEFWRFGEPVSLEVAYPEALAEVAKLG